MKKHLFVLCAFLFLGFSSLRAQITFTVLNTSGSNSITCATPTIHLLCITSYTAGFVTYTMSGPTGTALGNNFPATTPGTYTLTAFVTNVINSTQTLAIGINTTAPASALTPTTQNITCNFASVSTLSATATSPTNNVTHVFITPSGSSLTAQGYTATYLPGVAGTHTYMLINNANGCKTNKLFLVNSVSGIPTVSLSCPQNFTLGCGNNSICSVGLGGASSPAGSPISFTLLSTASSTNYITNSQNLYQLTSPGTYTVISHDNNSSCEARVLFSISSNTTSPTISLFTNSPTLSCNNSNSTLYGISTTPNTTYSWSTPGSTLNPSSFSINVSTTGIPSNSVIGIYTFQVISNANACTSETSITMYQNIYLPNALIGNNGSNSVTCTTPSVILTNQSSTGIPASAFSNTMSLVSQLWSGPSTPTSTGTSSIVAFSVGMYSLTVLDPNNGCSALATYALGDARVYPIVNNPAGPPPYCLDPPTTSVDISPILGGTVSNYTYAWSSPSSATVSGQTTATLTTNTVGTYTVVVTHTISGCSTTGNLVVTVCTGLSATENNKTALHLYPNPTQGKFSISHLADSEAQSLQILNASGKCIREYIQPSSVMEIDMENEVKGFYFIVLKDFTGQQYTIKLLLQ